jgi:Na+-transporting NADH:ubiquinone oxidoreductase subunit F
MVSGSYFHRKQGIPPFIICTLILLWLYPSLVSLATDLFQYQAKVVKIEDLTHDTKLVRFDLADQKNFHFTPGQYFFLKVPDNYVKEWNERYKTNHQEVMRPYSFASTSSKLPLFDVIIKRVSAPRGKDVPPGLASTFVHTRLQVGDVLQISQPIGDMVLRKDTRRPIIIVAGGTGAAPFISLLEYWFENQSDQKNEIHFYFGVRAKKDLFFDEQFRRWAQEKKNFHYLPALSNPEPGDDWKGETGYIQTVLDKYLKAPSDADAYLAGPPIMVTETVKVLNAKGITEERIHHDPIEVK